jgi:hypothetical protein
VRFHLADLKADRYFGEPHVSMLEIGNDRPDWPKMGPSLLIATCVILAIRAAKWPAVFDKSTSHPELDREIDFAAISREACSLI